MTKFTINNFLEYKQNNKKITILTAYDYSVAKIIDQAGVDAILVGDSLGTTVLGYEDTTKVTMEDMLHHIKAVVRGVERAFVIGDMPFLSYHIGKSESVKNAGRLVQEGGCKAVKLEGGAEIIESIEAIIAAGIPVMGHLGYIPQSINIFGGHKAQGKTFDTAKKIVEDAILLQKAGVFAIVLECVPYKLAELISQKLNIPVIGIGSGVSCDGQVLVSHDIFGFFRDFNPKHAKKYCDAYTSFSDATKQYVKEVGEGIFPKNGNSFIIDYDVWEKINENI